MATMTYSYDPYTGALVTTDPESGTVITYAKGKQISSKTASQVALESQIKSAGGTVTKQTEEQIALGLQDQVRSALKGKVPGSFEVTTPEGTFKATSGITPEHLRGATGSQLRAGYKTVDGREVPVDRKFTTSTGKEFSVYAKKKVGKEWIWQTPYGEVRATPGRLQTEIERLLTVQQITAKSKEIMAKKIQVIKESRTLPARLEFMWEQPFKGIGYMIGSTILHGDPFALEGLRKYEREREVWMEEILATKDRTGLALRGMIEPVATVVGAKFLPGIITGLGRSAIGTGIGLGVGGGLTTIATFETIEGIKSRDELKIGRGVLLGLAGIGLTKAVWETGVKPELEIIFPVREKTGAVSISDIEYRITKEEEQYLGGRGKAIARTRKGFTRVESDIEFQFTAKGLGKDITIGIEEGTIDTKIIESKWFGLRKEVTDLGKLEFTGGELAKKLPGDKDFYFSAFGTTTDETVLGIALKQKIMEDTTRGISVFKTGARTPEADIVSLDIVKDLTKMPSDPFLIEGSGDVGLVTERIVDVVQKDVLKPHLQTIELLPSVIAKPKAKSTFFIPSRTEAKSDIDLDIDLDMSLKATGLTEIKGKVDQDIVISPSAIIITDPFLDQKTDPDLRTGAISFQRMGIVEDTAQDQMLRLDQMTLTGTGVTTVPDPFITETGIGVPFGILWPDWKMKDDPFLATPSKKVKRGYADAPSLLAIEWDVRGKMPGVITGFGVRPLPKRTRKKRSRKTKDPFEVELP